MDTRSVLRKRNDKQGISPNNRSRKGDRSPDHMYRGSQKTGNKRIAS